MRADAWACAAWLVVVVTSSCGGAQAVVLDRATCEQRAECASMGACGPKPEPPDGWKAHHLRCEAGSDRDCKQSRLCARDGLCAFDPVGRHCIAGSTDACAASDLCLDMGWCGRSQACGSRCAAVRDEDCAASQACKTHGRCLRDGCDCVADPGRCATSDGCRVRGDCEAVGERCVVGPTTDCQRTELCAKYGYCTRISRDGQWRCAVTGVDDCRRSEACREWGMCHPALDDERRSICVADSDDDCRRSRRCATDGRCLALDGSCHRPAP